MDRYTATDKEYITYQESKDKGWNEYACREEELKRRLKAYEDTGLTPEEIMDGKMLTGWIPVEERLPGNDGDYLCTYTVLVNGSRKCLCHELSHELDEWYFDGYCEENIREFDGKVIAWMPPPEPYRPEEKIL